MRNSIVALFAYCTVAVLVAILSVPVALVGYASGAFRAVWWRADYQGDRDARDFFDWLLN